MNNPILFCISIEAATDDYSSVDEQIGHNTGDIDANSDMEVQQQKNDDDLHEIQEVSHSKSKEQLSHEANLDHLDGYSSNNENISNNLNDNSALDEDIAYIDYQQYSNSNEASNEHVYYNSSGQRSQASYMNTFKQQMAYKVNNNTPSGSRNILNSNYLKQQQQQHASPVQHSMMPSKKFRFINQSPTPQNNSYQSQQHNK